MDCTPVTQAFAIHAPSDSMHDFVPGLSLDCNANPYIDLAVGSYKNSLGKPSTFIAAAIETIKSDYRIGVFIAPATGYRYTITPVAGAILTIKQVQVEIIPPVRGLCPLTVGFSWRWN